MNALAGALDLARLPRPRVARATAILLLCASLASCSIFKLGKDLEVLYREVAIISGDIEVAPAISGLPIVLLVRTPSDGSTPTLVDYRFADGELRYNFQARPGVYRLMAFVDQNRDFVYQPGEPVTIQTALATTNRLDTRRPDWRFNHLRVEPAAAARLPIPADLSRDGLRRLERTVTTMGVPIDFESHRFRPANVSLGMWEPAKWFVEVNYGFYLLDEWAPDDPRDMVLLVHGINGSPRDFEAMLERLDTQRLRVALFHYPSGMRIEDNAYMLSQIMNELLLRSPDTHYTLLAHSMGGLLSKRFIQMQAAAGHAHLVDRFITLSTPWAGHRFAAAGAEYSPVVAPVWRDMAPSSDFIRTLREYALPEEIEYTMLFSHGGNDLMQVESNDGAVSLDSQLDPPMQDRADVLMGISQDHVGILTDPRTIEALDRTFAPNRQPLSRR